MNAKSIGDYFPKKPYDIQLQIASKLTGALEKGDSKIVVIESPTGTGKTYSLLCPIIAWLSRNRANFEVKEQGKSEKMPPWLRKTA
jgi:Rad3-related DNA helicase